MRRASVRRIGAPSVTWPAVLRGAAIPHRGWPVLSLLLALATGCGEDAPHGGSAPTVDRADPRAVAIAYLRAVARGDADSAAEYVAEEAREAFRARLSVLPGLPAEPDVVVETTRDAQEERARVRIRNAGGLTLSLRRGDGAWWVVP